MQTSPQPQNRPKAKSRFPACRWVARKLTGRWARRIYVAIFTLLLLITTAARLRSYFMVRKIQAVLRGLGEIRVDQTTEEQITKIVPYLVPKDWKAGGISHRGYYMHISNESDRLPQVVGVALTAIRSEELIEDIADWLGYRFVDFDAGVLVQDGRVSQAEYGLANQWERPQYAGYVGYLVSARSVHGFWLPRQMGFEVSSVDDYSPQYRPRRWGKTLNVIYTSDAPPEVTKRVFDLNLGCFWRLRGCNDAFDIAPEISRDVQRIQDATYQQLISEKCQDSIIEGRMRYLPDTSVLLLEVTGSRRVEVNGEGGRAEDWFTDYELKEVIRGRTFGSWKNVRFQRTIPSPMDPTRQIANQIWPSTKIGSQVLFFGGLGFDSCRFIPATPSALTIVRNTPVPTKRPEDQIPRGLL
jgi:hypothetical protein